MYNVLKDEYIIDALEIMDSVYYDTEDKEIYHCVEDMMEGVFSSDCSKIYHLPSMNSFPEEYTDYITVDSISEISEEDYVLLKQLLSSETKITKASFETEKVKNEENEFQKYKQNKISEMSDLCSKAIVSGTDVTLSDGNSYHFDMEITDQINMIGLKELAKSGLEKLPYHYSNGKCQYYSSADVIKIVDTCSQHVEYHTTYYNSLKIYINSMTVKEQVDAVTYGMEIPEEYRTDVLKEILNTDA